jgi:cytochrome c5
MDSSEQTGNDEKTIVVVDRRGSTLGILSFVFGFVSVFVLAPVFVPLAFLFGTIGLIRKQLAWSLVGIICGILGFLTSPILMGALGVATLVAMMEAPSTVPSKPPAEAISIPKTAPPNKGAVVSHSEKSQNQKKHVTLLPPEVELKGKSTSSEVARNDSLRHIESKDKSSAPGPGSELMGRWNGVVVRGERKYPASLTIKTQRGGVQRGGVDYPSRNCGSMLKRIGQENGSLFFKESVRYGKAKCADNEILVVSPQANGQSEVEWRNGKGKVVAAGVFSQHGGSAKSVEQKPSGNVGGSRKNPLLVATAPTAPKTQNESKSNQGENGVVDSRPEPSIAVDPTYHSICFSCHRDGVAGAPRVGDAVEWQKRSSKGLDSLVASVTMGLPGMPPKGACLQCSDEELRSAITYMLEASSGDIQVALDRSIREASYAARPTVHADSEPNAPVNSAVQPRQSAITYGVQQQLTRIGYSPGPVDGLMGPRTKREIMRYQANERILVDGNPTRELLLRLQREYRGHAQRGGAVQPLRSTLGKAVDAIFEGIMGIEAERRPDEGAFEH